MNNSFYSCFELPFDGFVLSAGHLLLVRGQPMVDQSQFVGRGRWRNL